MSTCRQRKVHKFHIVQHFEKYVYHRIESNKGEYACFNVARFTVARARKLNVQRKRLQQRWVKCM
jgi:hypothetical protein